jgi:methionyl-tRNA synthetase
MEKFYLTTAIDYVNGAPHIGHAYEKIISDIIVRHFRQRSDNVYFLTGTDEHGIKIQKTAAAAGITPQELCDANAQKFKDAWAQLDIAYSKFGRTTDDQHKRAVQDIFKKLLDKGDIYKHAYKGLYCAGCECFLAEKDLVDGLCPVHNKAPELVSEENYFFRLSKYRDAIAAHIKASPDFILPAWRAAEVLNQLEDTQDISVSRSAKSVQWGIPVSSDPEQTIYVWIDALSNYYTQPDAGWWPATVHVIGKDILKFHAIYWTGILMALELPLPQSIFAHGWITIDAAKMSKTTGNVIAPGDILKSFNLDEPDALRYYMASAANAGKDGNYSDEDFKEKVNAHLANGMGNLLNRTLSMLKKYDCKAPQVKTPDYAAAAIEKVNAHFDKYEVAEAAHEIMMLVDTANKYVTDNAPWTLAKNGEMEKCAEVLATTLEIMRVVTGLIAPYCPNIAQRMERQLSFEAEIEPVFLRMDSELADKSASLK